MTVTIRVGFGHDCTLPEPPKNTMGVMHVGLNGLLGWLETQLGLELPEVSFTVRMVQYLGCLKSSDNEQRFYHASFKADELGVARQLLQWRDIWYESGWNGEEFPAGSPSRLQDMAEVEESARDAVAPGRGQRLQRVLDALENDPLDLGVELVDPLQAFPHGWSELLGKLGAKTSELHHPGARPDTDLGRLQQCLAGGNTTASRKKLKLSGDGSVVVLRADSPHISAPWIARFAHTALEEREDRSVAVLARVGGEVLDDALDEAGFARLGFSSASVWRPVFQVLPLVMELLWEPLDPRPLLQFLSHPVAPITARVRTRLAEAVSEEPGIGGGKWLASIETALEEQKQAGKNDRELDTLRTAIDFWLHNDRYPPAAGTPLEGIRQRAKMVRDWLAASTPVQASDVSRSLFNAAYGQAEELIGALDRLQAGGSTMISRETLRRLIESTRSSGAGRPDKQAECIPGEQQLLRADDPSGFIGPVPVVVWWGCGRESLPANYPWSITEQRHLAQNGIRLQPVEEKLGWQADSWLRPILAATDRLLLVFHADAESHHPVWDRIAAIAEGWVEADILSLAQTPSSGSSLVEQPETEPLTVNPLPGFSRWWQLPDGKGLSRRESESYSSLEKFLFGPYQWVLNYKARLRKGALAEVSDGNLLKGNLAHMLFEWFFNAHTDLSLVERSAAEAWARRELPGLIEQSGAMLLAPGRQHERESFLSVVTRALGALLDQLQSARVVGVQMEHWQEGGFTGGKLNGAIDLVATNSNGREALLDIKWGAFKYRRRSLTESSYLQLATYAEMRRQATGRWPALGYFVIEDARLLALDTHYFPQAEVYAPENGESVAEYWQRFQCTWRWRREQLDGGLIEAPITGTEPSDTLPRPPGEKGLPLPDHYDSFNDYAVLTGWKEDA